MLILPEFGYTILVMPLPKRQKIIEEISNSLVLSAVESGKVSPAAAPKLVEKLEDFLATRINTIYYELLSDEHKAEVWANVDTINLKDHEMILNWYENLSDYIEENPMLVDSKLLHERLNAQIVPAFSQYLQSVLERQK